MATKLIETISPQRVYNRVVAGILIVFFTYLFWDSILLEEDEVFKWFIVIFGFALFLSGWRAVTNPLRAVKYASNPEAVVGDLIEKWKPENFKAEHQLEKALQTYLKRELPWVKITRQYGAGRVKCDVAVGKDVMIELKSGFKSTQKLQRLIGQLELYKKEWAKPIVVVLAGETEEDLLHDLNSHTKQLGHIQIVTKEDVSLVEESADSDHPGAPAK